jgi:hypothetical protein
MDARVTREPAHTIFVPLRTARDRPSEMDGSQRFGLNHAQVGKGNHGLGLRCIMKFLRGLGRTVISVSGQK